MEENFPRGGSEPVSTRQKRKFVEESEEEKEEEGELFKHGKSSVKSEKTRKPQKQRRLKKDVMRAEERKSFLEVASVGTLVLGCVREVREYELVVSLPGGVRGTALITSISDAYTAALTRIAEDSNCDQDSVPTLGEIFRVGMIVRCRVLEIDNSEKGWKSVKLSLNPRDVNGALSMLKTGFVLVGSVRSCEDHGYVLDLGLPGVSAFLSTAEAKKYLEATDNNEAHLYVGQQLHCMVSGSEHVELAAGESRVVSVVADPRVVHRSLVTDSMKLSVQKLLPGLVASCKVIKMSEDGLTVKFLSYTGFVVRTHLESPPLKYCVDQEVKLAVLYVHPVTKVIHLTELSHLVTPDLAPLRLFGALIVGDVLPSAEVSRVDKARGAYLKLDNGLRAFASVKQISLNDSRNICTSFKRGSTRKCRVLDFNYLDRLVFVSCKRSVIEQEFFGYRDLKPAMTIQCTVTKVHVRGVSVKITGYIHGFIPHMNLSEVPLKNPEKKFTVGKKLKCKVLTVDADNSKLVLIHKKSLTNSTCPSITDYSQCRPGVIAEGFVATIKPTGVLVVFYNNVKGWVPVKELGAETAVSSPERLFYRGQVVKTRVLNCREQHGEMKLFLSLKIDADATALMDSVPENFTIGTMSECRVVAIGNEGLQVELLPLATAQAFLPKMHLSDHRSNCDQLMSVYSVGDVIDRVMFFRKSSGQKIVTKKASIIRASEDGHLVTDFDIMQVGMILTGVVNKKMTYGVFVDINGFNCLVPNKYIVDTRHPDAQSLLYEGQSVAPKVVEVERESKRCLLSLRLSDTHDNDTDVGVALLDDYLREYQAVHDRITLETDPKWTLAQVAVGQVVDVTVSQVTKLGVLCLTDSSVKGFATMDNMTGVVCKEGERHKALVLYIDMAAACIQLTLVTDAIKAVQHCKHNKFSQVRPLQTIKSEVLLITEDFVLVLLKGHASGQLAYLPARRHLNDFAERHQYNVGQLNLIVIKKVIGSRILASLELHEDADVNKADAKLTGKYLVRDLPRIGSIHTARVTQLYKLQMNVTVNGVPGRVYVTEVSDDTSTAKNPLQSYSTGMEFSVKILAYREQKTNKYLPVSHPSLSRVLLECTCKSSKLAKSTSTDLLNYPAKLGDSVVAYVVSHDHKCIRVQLSPVVKGTVHILNASNDPKVRLSFEYSASLCDIYSKPYE